MSARRILAALLTLSIAVSGPGLARVGSAQPAPTQQLALFSTASAAEERLVSRLRDVDINRLTPIDALTLLASLKKDAES